MKATGIVRNIDGLGRITVPKEIRKHLAIGDETPLEMFIDEEGMYFKIYRTTCVFCGKFTKDELLGKKVCLDCQRKIKE